MQPNLFKFATSELSQDAFICWMLSWAKPEYKDVDNNLHQCGVKLIESFFAKHGKSLSSPIDEIEVIKQDSYIDVLCIINKKYVVLIEDKTGTKSHGSQLKRYLAEIKNRSYEEDNILPIYFKTRDQANYKNIEKENYKVFLRDDFLEILNFGNKLGIDNAIFQDFRKHLQDISDAVESYLVLPVENWHWNSWIGFYLRLQKELTKGNWDYVPNPSGGFLGFWWGFQGDETCQQYLQLEQRKFCIKIKVKNKADRKILRNKWYKLAKEKFVDFEKPSRFGSGTYMTILVNKEYIKVNDDGIVDITATVKYFREKEGLLKSISDDS